MNLSVYTETIWRFKQKIKLISTLFYRSVLIHLNFKTISNQCITEIQWWGQRAAAVLCSRLGACYWFLPVNTKQQRSHIAKLYIYIVKVLYLFKTIDLKWQVLHKPQVKSIPCLHCRKLWEIGNGMEIKKSIKKGTEQLWIHSIYICLQKKGD